MELTLDLPQGQERLGVTGVAEKNLKTIREALGVQISSRDHTVRISGSSHAVGLAVHILEELLMASKRHQPISHDRLVDMISLSSSQSLADHAPSYQRYSQSLRHPAEERRPSGTYQTLNKSVKPITLGQTRYIEAINCHDLTFCLGPAGTGKTYLAVASAAAMLKSGEIRKLVLVRPAVEAGEKLGFLPGSMQEKVNPYLRPLLDALYDILDVDQVQRFIACDLIEIIPLAFMRGRTLNSSLIILDEAQNTTKQQMLMFLTRMGHNSKMIITGDTTQIDLPDPTQSGLIDAIQRLRRVDEIAIVTLEPSDIVRHHLVQKIVDAYDASDSGGKRRTKSASQELMIGTASGA